MTEKIEKTLKWKFGERSYIRVYINDDKFANCAIDGEGTASAIIHSIKGLSSLKSTLEEVIKYLEENKTL